MFLFSLNAFKLLKKGIFPSWYLDSFREEKASRIASEASGKYLVLSTEVGETHMPSRFLIFGFSHQKVKFLKSVDIDCSQTIEGIYFHNLRLDSPVLAMSYLSTRTERCFVHTVFYDPKTHYFEESESMRVKVRVGGAPWVFGAGCLGVQKNWCFALSSLGQLIKIVYSRSDF